MKKLKEAEFEIVLDDNELQKESIIDMMRNKKPGFFGRLIFLDGCETILASLATLLCILPVAKFTVSSVNFLGTISIDNYIFLGAMAIIFSHCIFSGIYNISEIFFKKILEIIQYNIIAFKYNKVLSKLPKENKKDIFICLLEKENIKISDLQASVITENYKNSSLHK